MPSFSVNTSRHEPYKNFKFRLKWDGKYVAGISKMSPLAWKNEPISHREGGDRSAPHVMPSATKCEPITLERGVTHDLAFEAWASLVHNYNGDAARSLANFRKDLIVELLNEQGTVAKAWKVYGCWVSEYHALPELDANGNAVAIEKIVLQVHGWERDTSVTEPKET